jgi:endo-1,4-beta-xylanase
MTINTNKCVGPAYNGTGNSTVMEVQDCNGGAAQAWSITLVSGTTDTFNFKNVASNRCLDVAGASTAEGARLQIYDCHTGNNQKFAVSVN